MRADFGLLVVLLPKLVIGFTIDRQSISN